MFTTVQLSMELMGFPQMQCQAVNKQLLLLLPPLLLLLLLLLLFSIASGM
jgi:hypothetical protein